MICVIGKCKILHGRPRHPQSQGLIEQSNGTMKTMLASMLLEQKTDDWPSLLPKIMFNLNTQKHSKTGFTPFQLMFNRLANLSEKSNIN